MMIKLFDDILECVRATGKKSRDTSENDTDDTAESNNSNVGKFMKDINHGQWQ